MYAKWVPTHFGRPKVPSVGKALNPFATLISHQETAGGRKATSLDCGWLLDWLMGIVKGHQQWSSSSIVKDIH